MIKRGFHDASGELRSSTYFFGLLCASLLVILSLFSSLALLIGGWPVLLGREMLILDGNQIIFAFTYFGCCPGFGGSFKHSRISHIARYCASCSFLGLISISTLIWDPILDFFIGIRFKACWFIGEKAYLVVWKIADLGLSLFSTKALWNSIWKWTSCLKLTYRVNVEQFFVVVKVISKCIAY